MKDKYFAKLADEELLGALSEKICQFHEAIDRHGLSGLWEKSYRAYYGRDEEGFTSSEVGRAGTQGELSKIIVNEYRNFIMHLHAITTNQRPAFKARAANTDSKSMSQAVLADGLIEYYMYEKALSDYTDRAAELSLVFGEGWTVMDWDATQGDLYGVDENENPIYEGDIVMKNYAPMEVVRDVCVNSVNDLQWIILRSSENKYDLLEKYPEKKDKILEYTRNMKEDLDNNFYGDGYLTDNTDEIPKYIFIHKKTTALPEGRRVEFLNSSCILMDTSLPYRNMAAFRMAPNEILGMPFGYTIGFDLLGINDVVNALHSVVATNQTTFGVQNIIAEEGSDVSPHQLGGALNIIYHRRGSQAPQALNLTYTPPEIFNYIGMLSTKMETLSGINSILRGDAPPNVRSGNAMALLHAQAVQFNSGLQKSYSHHLEKVVTGLLRMLQDFAEIPRIAAIVGEFERSYLTEFKGEDIAKINRVHVELVNPVARTAAGRAEMAENLLQGGHVNANEYMAVIETGRLKPMTEGPTRELLLIRRENEEIQNGGQAVAVITDNHPVHIQEHKNVLSDPEARRNPQVVQAVTVHMQDHIELMKNMSPEMAGILQMPAMQGPPQGAPQGQGGAPVGQSEQAGMSGPMDQADMPSMPTNPITGQEYNPETGQ